MLYLVSKLITCFIGDFNSKTKSQSVASLLNGSEHIYWILDLEGGVHSMWDLWISGLQECKGYGFFLKLGRRATIFGQVQKNLDFMDRRLPLLESSWGGGSLMSSVYMTKGKLKGPVGSSW